MKDATYIKVKEGKLLVSDMVKPNKSHYVINDDGLERYASAIEAFDQSFVEAENKKLIWEHLPISAFDQERDLKDGLYPISGLQFNFEVGYVNDGGSNLAFKYPVAILSLKQEQPQKAVEPSEEKDAIQFADFLLGDFEMDTLDDGQTLCWKLAGTNQKYTTQQAYKAFKTQYTY